MGVGLCMSQDRLELVYRRSEVRFDVALGDAKELERSANLTSVLTKAGDLFLSGTHHETGVTTNYHSFPLSHDGVRYNFYIAQSGSDQFELKISHAASGEKPMVVNSGNCLRRELVATTPVVKRPKLFQALSEILDEKFHAGTAIYLKVNTLPKQARR